MAIVASGSGTFTTVGGDVTFVLPGTVRTTTGAVSNTIEAGAGGTFDLYNDGTIISVDDDAVNIQIDDFDASVYNSSAGIIRGADTGVLVFSSTNGSSFYAENHGEISGGDEGFFVSGAITGDNAFIVNTGSISGVNHGIETDRATTIVNSGTISSSSEAIDFRTNFSYELINSGLITGDFRAVSAGGPLSTVTITNSGTIQGGFDAIRTNDGNDSLRNTGLIAGNVATLDGNDTFRNQGDIFGDLDLGFDNDTYNGYGGHVSGILDAGSGNDTIRIDDADAAVNGGLGLDVLIARSDVLNVAGFEEISLVGTGDFSAFGDDETFRLNGNVGDNQLFGGQLANIVLAGAGDDVVEGFAGNDTMRGNGGNDELQGGADNDVIFGGTGDDTITGGRGRDILYGDQGRDVFVFESVLDSAASADRDIIVGFERGRDEIDVSAIDDNAFAFVGTSGFSATGGMELGYRVVAGGTQVVVEMDENGDGLVDAEIRVRGVGELAADDFVL